MFSGLDFPVLVIDSNDMKLVIPRRYEPEEKHPRSHPQAVVPFLRQLTGIGPAKHATGNVDERRGALNQFPGCVSVGVQLGRQSDNQAGLRQATPSGGTGGRTTMRNVATGPRNNERIHHMNPLRPLD